MSDINIISLEGTIMRDPVFRLTKSETSMTTFQLCVHRREPSRACDYLDIVAWSDLADLVRAEFRAGDRVRMKGSLRKSNFMGLDGRKHLFVQIIAEEIERAEPEPGYEADGMEQLCAA